MKMRFRGRRQHGKPVALLLCSKQRARKCCGGRGAGIQHLSGVWYWGNFMDEIEGGSTDGFRRVMVCVCVCVLDWAEMVV